MLDTRALVALAALAAGCSATPSHFTRLWVEGRTGLPEIGVSTEAGVLVVPSPDWKVGDRLELQFPHGNSSVYDIGVIDRMNENVAIVLPETSKLSRGRFATALPAPGEELYLALRDEFDEPVMEPVLSWREGAFGDWLLLRDHDAAEVARNYRGTGVYVHRDDRWEIVGLLGGLLAVDRSDPRGETALGFIGLVDLARILPVQLDYLSPDLKPLRPDFEFGVPLQPGDLEGGAAESEPPATTPAPAPAPAPAPR